MVLLAICVLLIAAAAALWFLPRDSRWHWKLVSRTTAGILACGSAFTLLLFLFGRVACGRYDFPPVSTRDGKLVAEVTEEDCGAVDSFHSSVDLWYNRQGFFAHLLGKRGHKTTVFTVGNDPRRINISWKDERTLLIRYPSDSPEPGEFSCQSRWDGIQIECVGYLPDYNEAVGNMPPAQRGFW